MIETRERALYYGCLLAGLTFTSACRVHRTAAGGGGMPATQGSIVLGVEGVSPEALALKPTFFLVCDGRSKKEDGSVEDEKVIFETASDIQPGDTCAMEVRLPEPDKVPSVKNWEWYGYQGKTKDVGLLYGSSRGKVTDDRELELELYKLYGEPSSDLGITETPDGPCIRYEKPKCLDRRSFKLENPTRMMMRVLAAKAGDKSPTAFVITPGDAKGIGIMTKGEITADGLSQALVKSPQASYKVSVFKDFDIVEKVLSVPFEQDLMAGKPLATQAAADADIKDYKILALDKIWTHGWESLPDSHALDKLSEPRWFAKVTAQKDKDKTEFLVAGAKKYFVSSAKTKAVRNGQTFAVYYAWPEIVGNVRDGGSDVWRIYGLSDGALVPSECKNASLSYYLADIGALSQTDLAGDKPIAALDACEIKGTLLRADLNTWSATAQFYVWRWSAPL